jgi:hypothetical protein
VCDYDEQRLIVGHGAWLSLQAGKWWVGGLKEKRELGRLGKTTQSQGEAVILRFLFYFELIHIT